MASDAEYGLVLPFVAVTSKGGPYEDQAYTAGWEMGQLDARLSQLRNAAGGNVVTVGAALQATNQQQADLVAMHHGFTMIVLPGGDCADHGEWIMANFTYAGGGDD